MTLISRGYLIVGLLLLSMPAQAQSFNCRTADRPDEVLICQSPRLASLDERMSSLYFRLRNRVSPMVRRELEDSQRDWLASRIACGRDFRCVASAYEQRIAELSRF
jgi:uncharacterized protein